MNDCERSPNRTGLRVNFSDKGEVKERREKFLTAKYGSHQMSLIRKRLAVEMWLYDELQKLFDPPVSKAIGKWLCFQLNLISLDASSWLTYCLVSPLQTEAIDVDIDEILDMDTDDVRRSHLVVSSPFRILNSLVIMSGNVYVSHPPCGFWVILLKGTGIFAK